MESQLSTHDYHTLENSHASEVPTTKVGGHSPNEEERNITQHEPEKEG